MMFEMKCRGQVLVGRPVVVQVVVLVVAGVAVGVAVDVNNDN